MTIELSREVRQQMIGSLRRYLAEEMNEEIGDLKASLLLDFFLKEIGPTVYNRAVTDAQTYLQGALADMEGSVYRPEFGYWPKKRGPA
jgi:uncharacterized protein (DUF2164 family)